MDRQASVHRPRLFLSPHHPTDPITLVTRVRRLLRPHHRRHRPPRRAHLHEYPRRIGARTRWSGCESGRTASAISPRSAPTFAPQHRELLEGLGVDLRGLLSGRALRPPAPGNSSSRMSGGSRSSAPTSRISTAIEPRLDEMPADYFAARGFHICHGTLRRDADVVTRLRAANPAACIVWEPTPLQLSATADEFRAVLSPGRRSSRPIAARRRRSPDRTRPKEPSRTLLDWGAPIVALRMGAEGSRWTRPGEVLSHSRGAGERRRHHRRRRRLLWRLPRRSWQRARPRRRPAPGPRSAPVSRSSSSASPAFDEQTRDEAERRLAWARERIVASRRRSCRRSS